MINSINVVDLIFLIFTLIFVLTALFRGLIKEVFAFSNWVISFVLSYLFAPYLSPFLHKFIASKIAGDLTARGIIFLLCFLIIALSTSSLCKALREATPKTLDRVLGVFFAFFKSIVVFGFIYSIYVNMYGFLLGNKLNKPENIEHPKILTDAKTYNLIKNSGEFLDPAVSLFFKAIAKNIEYAIVKSLEFENKINQTVDDKSINPDAINGFIDQLPNDISNKVNNKIEEMDSGYEKKDIDKINNLIETIDKK